MRTGPCCALSKLLFWPPKERNGRNAARGGGRREQITSKQRAARRERPVPQGALEANVYWDLLFLVLSSVVVRMGTSPVVLIVLLLLIFLFSSRISKVECG